MTADRQTHTGDEDIDLSPEDAQDDDRRGKRSLWGLISLILTVVLIIIVLLMLRNCGIGVSDTASSRGEQTIEPVPGRDPVEGMVSVWLREGGDITTVLQDGGISSGGAIDMGEGHYVVTVDPGAEDRAVNALAKTATVIDAGLVYAAGTSLGEEDSLAP